MDTLSDGELSVTVPVTLNWSYPVLAAAPLMSKKMAPFSVKFPVFRTPLPLLPQQPASFGASDTTEVDERVPIVPFPIRYVLLLMLASGIDAPLRRMHG